MILTEVRDEILSLYYMYSVMYKSGDVYEFSSSVELNDTQMSVCESVRKADFMSGLCEESERLFNERDDLHYKQQWLQINLKTLMELQRSQNHTQDTDLHVVQWRHGCAVELLSDGSVFLKGTDEYAYDGQTLTSDLSMHWKPLVLDHNVTWDRESASSLERRCEETLSSFTALQREGKILMKSRPRVHALVRASGSSVELLVCLATGFYPKHVQMEIRRRQTPSPDDWLTSEEIRPNADGSFQLRKSLEIRPSERSQYQCVLEHQSLADPLIVHWGGEDCSDCELTNMNLIPTESGSLWMWDALTGFVDFVCILAVFTIIVFTFYQLRKHVKHPKEQDTLKTPSLVKLSDLHKTQMNPELLDEIRAETCAGLTAFNDSEDENPTDPTEDLHETQSLGDTEVTPAAARGAMGSKNISLPNFDSPCTIVPGCHSNATGNYCDVIFYTTHTRYPHKHRTMEDIECALFLVLGMWLFLTARRQTLFQERLRAAKQNTAEKNRIVWELLQSSGDETNLVVQSRRKRSTQQTICLSL